MQGMRAGESVRTESPFAEHPVELDPDALALGRQFHGALIKSAGRGLP